MPNAQCTILSCQDFGKVVPGQLDPAPVDRSPCEHLGNISHYLLAISSSEA